MNRESMGCHSTWWSDQDISAPTACTFAPGCPWQCKKALRLLIDVESNETEAYKYVSASQSAKNAKEMAVCWINLSDYSLYKQGKLARRTNGKWNLIL